MYTLLLIEDEDIIRTGLRVIIRDFDMPISEIYEAGSGKQAKELYKRHLPDIVITDIVMPGESGLDIVADIKRMNASNPELLVISGYDDFKYAQNAIQLGTSNYLLKPVKREQLYEALQSMIKKIRQRRNDEINAIIVKKHATQTQEQFRGINAPGENNVYDDITDEDKINGLIEHALKYIHDNISKPLDLETISKELLINPNYFSHLFKKKTNVNFVTYLQKARVEYAKELLANPLLRIYQVAEKVGFNNEKYFCSIFKRFTKYTPGQYRKMIMHTSPPEQF